MKKRIEKEFTDEEIDSYVQEFRRGKLKERDPNEEKFPRDEQDLRSYIATLIQNYEKTSTEELREELRVYKAHYSGWYKGFSVAFEYLMAESDRIQREHPEEEIKPTLFDGGPMFKDEEEFQKMKKVLADDPDTPKGHWIEDGQKKTYMFDKPKKEKGKK